MQTCIADRQTIGILGDNLGALYNQNPYSKCSSSNSECSESFPPSRHDVLKLITVSVISFLHYQCRF